MKIDETKAAAILESADKSRQHKSDQIGESVDGILNGSHKTYRYVLVTALLAKSVDAKVDIFSLQAKDTSAGAYDARSLCHHVLVPFERSHYPNSLGGSNEPFLNKPARFTRISMDNAVRGGNDHRILEELIRVLTQIKRKSQALEYLRSALYTMSEIYNEYEQKFELPDLDIPASNLPQTTLDYINALIRFSFEGEICPLVVATLEHFYYQGNRKVVPHKVNESGASSKEVGDIDIYTSADELVSSIEVKDKDFTKEDVEHAINKFATSRIEKSLFVFGKKVSFNHEEVFKTAAVLGKKGYFCSVISIETFAKMRLYSMRQPFSVQEFIAVMLSFSKQINAKEETVNWIKQCAAELAL